MNNTSILDTVLGNIDTKRAKNMERRMMLAVKIAEGINYQCESYCTSHVSNALFSI